MLRAEATRPDLADPRLHALWADLAAGCSPFLSWEWVGCLAAERYTDPVLVTVRDGAAPVGLALFNRRRSWRGSTLFLHETGDPAWDGVFIEHNGIAADPARAPGMLDAVLGCALRLASRVVLSGVDGAGLEAARRAGTVARLHTRPAPFRKLQPGAILPGLSRNTRAQLRRSDRSYGAPPEARDAGSVAEALDWLDRLVALHDRTWSARGVSSGFLRAPVQRFHRELIARSGPAGVARMLRVDAGPRTVGFLLNLCGGGGMAAYQGGFDYAGAEPQGKPGLSSHAAAMALAAERGWAEYDFLAGEGRYKRSLADRVRELHWLEVCRPASLAGMEAGLRRLLGR